MSDDETKELTAAIRQLARGLPQRYSPRPRQAKPRMVAIDRPREHRVLVRNGERMAVERTMVADDLEALLADGWQWIEPQPKPVRVAPIKIAKRVERDADGVERIVRGGWAAIVGGELVVLHERKLPAGARWALADEMTGQG